jgi:hypothetical protein
MAPFGLIARAVSRHGMEGLRGVPRLGFPLKASFRAYIYLFVPEMGFLDHGSPLVSNLMRTGTGCGTLRRSSPQACPWMQPPVLAVVHTALRSLPHAACSRLHRVTRARPRIPHDNSTGPLPTGRQGPVLW